MKRSRMPLAENDEADGRGHEIGDAKRQAEAEDAERAHENHGEYNVEAVLTNVEEEWRSGIAVSVEPSENEQIRREADEADRKPGKRIAGVLSRGRIKLTPLHEACNRKWSDDEQRG